MGSSPFNSLPPAVKDFHETLGSSGFFKKRKIQRFSFLRLYPWVFKKYQNDHPKKSLSACRSADFLIVFEPQNVCDSGYTKSLLENKQAQSTWFNYLLIPSLAMISL
jgi:hypothetical protein